MRIEETTIIEIASYAFVNLPFLESIEFTSVIIQVIKPCSLCKIKGPAVIEFKESQIDRLESGAISHMAGLQKINISYTIIENMDAHAFFNIHVREFEMFDVEITNMKTSSFSSIFNVEIFKFDMVYIHSVQAGAFKSINNIKKVIIDRSTFGNMSCNAIMELREATPGNHETFVFTSSKFLKCSCLSLPMLEYARSNGYIMPDSISCASEGQRDIPFTSFKFPTSCAEEVRKSCVFTDPPAPACGTKEPQITVSTMSNIEISNNMDITTSSNVDLITSVNVESTTFSGTSSTGSAEIFSFVFSACVSYILT